MIVRPKVHWFRMLFVWRGSVLRLLIPRLAMLFVLSAAVSTVRGQLFDVKVPLNPAPFTLSGVALAIFLGFRNTVSYDRFWEGRKLWGGLVNDSRSLVRQGLALLREGAPRTGAAEFARLVAAFAHATKHQLRKTDPAADLNRLLPPALAAELSRARFKPVMILLQLGRWLESRRADEGVEPVRLLPADQSLVRLSDHLGGCERIAATPIPFAYAVLLHRTVYVYCFLLPFGLVDSIGWATPVIVVFIAYTFMALDAIASELEDPFGADANDLPLDSICSGLEASVLELVGEDGPAPVLPANYVLR